MQYGTVAWHAVLCRCVLCYVIPWSGVLSFVLPFVHGAPCCTVACCVSIRRSVCNPLCSSAPQAWATAAQCGRHQKKHRVLRGPGIKSKNFNPMSGRLNNSLMFFSGIDTEPPWAGITAMPRGCAVMLNIRAKK